MRFAAHQCKRHGQAVIASLLTSLLLLLGALAASPQLHEQFHPDANSSQHQCAVTLFAHGQVDAASVEISAAVPSAAMEIGPQSTFTVFAPAIENLPAGRAPPVALSNS